jgi:WD40 repeat protein
MNIRILLTLVLILILACIVFGDGKANTLAIVPGTPTPTPALLVGFPPLTIDNANWVAQLAVFHLPSIYDLSWSADGTNLALASSTGIWVYNMDSPQSPLHLTDLSTFDVSFSPTRNLLASVSGRNELRLWDMSTGTLQIMSEDPSRHQYSVEFSPDGIHLVSSSWWEDYTIRLWDTSTGDSLTVFQGHTDVPLSMGFSPDGETLITVADGWDHTIRLWDTSTGESLAVQPISTIDNAHVGLCGAALNLNDGLAALGTCRGEIRIWDISTGKELDTLEGHTARVRGLAFNPDGTLLASGDDAGEIRIWDVSTGEELGILEGHTASVNLNLKLTFSPDGTLLASAGRDNTVRLWGVSR